MTLGDKPCSALVNGVCTNGFVRVPACAHGYGSGPYNVVPCMSEDWCARLFPETGQPSAADIARAHARAYP